MAQVSTFIAATIARALLCLWLGLGVVVVAAVAAAAAPPPAPAASWAGLCEFGGFQLSGLHMRSLLRLGKRHEMDLAGLCSKLTTEQHFLCFAPPTNTGIPGPYHHHHTLWSLLAGSGPT